MKKEQYVKNILDVQEDLPKSLQRLWTAEELSELSVKELRLLYQVYLFTLWRLESE